MSERHPDKNFNRVLLKLSGESLAGNDGYGISGDMLVQYAHEIKKIVDMGVQVGIVIGGGNIFRGVSEAAKDMDRVSADYMGMLATVMNSMALQNALENIDCNYKHGGLSSSNKTDIV